MDALSGRIQSSPFFGGGNLRSFGLLLRGAGFFFGFLAAMRVLSPCWDDSSAQAEFPTARFRGFLRKYSGQRAISRIWFAIWSARRADGGLLCRAVRDALKRASRFSR